MGFSLKVRTAVFETATTGSIPATLANMSAIPTQPFRSPQAGTGGVSSAGAGGSVGGSPSAGVAGQGGAVTING